MSPILSTDFSFNFHITTRFTTNGKKNETVFHYFLPSIALQPRSGYMVQYVSTSIVITYNNQKLKGVFINLIFDQKINVEDVSGMWLYLIVQMNSENIFLSILRLVCRANNTVQCLLDGCKKPQVFIGISQQKYYFLTDINQSWQSLKNT